MGLENWGRSSGAIGSLTLRASPGAGALGQGTHALRPWAMGRVAARSGAVGPAHSCSTCSQGLISIEDCGRRHGYYVRVPAASHTQGVLRYTMGGTRMCTHTQALKPAFPRNKYKPRIDPGKGGERNVF